MNGGFLARFRASANVSAGYAVFLSEIAIAHRDPNRGVAATIAAVVMSFSWW